MTKFRHFICQIYLLGIHKMLVMNFLIIKKFVYLNKKY